MEYQDWLNNALKTLICDEIAPSRPAETWGRTVLTMPLSQWQNHMGTSWQHFDHPRHGTLFPEAVKLINALEDPRDGHWDRFTTSLHKAISQETLPLLAQALKSLGGAAGSGDAGEPRPETVPQRSVGPTPTAVAPKSISNWEELEIRFLSDERVQITIGEGRETLNYAEFDFEDRRTKKPNQAWVMLRELAKLGGTIKQPRDSRGWSNVEKRVQEIRRVLRKRFKLESDPLPFTDRAGYRALFKISCAPSFNA